jgi:hypothetical protein
VCKQQVEAAAAAPYRAYLPDCLCGRNLVTCLARPHRWQRMLDERLRTSVSEIGEAEIISKSYVTWILQRTLLGHDTVERTLDGRGQSAWRYCSSRPP